MDRSVLLVDDDPDILRSVGTYLERSGYEVLREPTGEAALERYEQAAPDLVLLDLHLPGLTGFDVLEALRPLDAAVIVLTGNNDVETAVRAMQLGAENFLTKPVDLPHLLLALDRVHDKVRMRHHVRRLSSQDATAVDLDALGSSPQMQEVARQVELVAASDDTTVLIVGESGTGKGYLARLIHHRSARAGGPFIDLNCGGLNASFLDMELFGADADDAGERRRNPGLLEAADHGTILLDAVGDLALELQPKLVGVLEHKRFRRVGGTREIQVDVRVLAATNRNLPALVEAGTFRDDLYYRLNILTITLPPVRDRNRDDRLTLLQRLLADLWKGEPGTEPTIDTVALERLLAYGWPGNVREMRNVLERALMLGAGASSIALEHLPGEIRRAAEAGELRYEGLTLRDVERRQIAVALRHHRGNRTHAARDLGISRATLIKKVKLYDLDA